MTRAVAIVFALGIMTVFLPVATADRASQYDEAKEEIEFWLNKVLAGTIAAILGTIAAIRIPRALWKLGKQHERNVRAAEWHRTLTREDEVAVFACKLLREKTAGTHLRVPDAFQSQKEPPSKVRKAVNVGLMLFNMVRPQRIASDDNKVGRFLIDGTVDRVVEKFKDLVGPEDKHDAAVTVLQDMKNWYEKRRGDPDDVYEMLIEEIDAKIEACGKPPLSAKDPMAAAEALQAAARAAAEGAVKPVAVAPSTPITTVKHITGTWARVLFPERITFNRLDRDEEIYMHALDGFLGLLATMYGEIEKELMTIEDVERWLAPILEPLSQPNRLWIPGTDGKGIVVIAFLWEPYLKQAHPAVHKLVKLVKLSFPKPLPVKHNNVAFDAYKAKYAINEDERHNKRFPNALAWVCNSVEEQKKWDAFVDGTEEVFKPWWIPQVGRGEIDLAVYSGNDPRWPWDKGKPRPRSLTAPITTTTWFEFRRLLSACTSANSAANDANAGATTAGGGPQSTKV